MHGLKLPYRNPDIDREAYLAWYEEGTIFKAAQRMKEKGILTIRKTHYSPDGVRKAAVRHMINNYDEVRENLLKLYSENGYIVEEAKIDRFMIKMAVSALRNPERVKFWMIQHNLMEKYGDFLESLIAV